MSSEKPSDAIAATEESSQESSTIEAGIEPEILTLDGGG